MFGEPRTRWTLAALGRHVSWLAGYSVSGVWRAVRALGVRWKRAREHVHSPDPACDEKRIAIAASRTASRTSGGRVVTLFQDEVTLHRQPSLAAAWSARGRDHALAERSYRADAPTRIVGTLAAAAGRVLVRRRSKLTVPALVGFYQAVAAAYPDATRIDVVLDNWPVHFHPDLLAALVPQTSPFPFPRPPAWPAEPSAAAVRAWGDLQLPIQLLPLPTYASWLNPIEKLWRWLRQEVVHLHPWADDLPALRAAADAFFAQFTAGTDSAAALLCYTGLKSHD
jgi:hypothetical protein